MENVVKPWHRLSWAVVEAPFLEGFTTHRCGA